MKTITQKLSTVALVTSIALATSFSFSVGAATQSDKAPEADLSKVEGTLYKYERTLPMLETAYFSSSPERRKDGLNVGKLKTTQSIEQLAKDIAADKYGHYDSLLIAHKNTLVFESYYRKGRINMPHPQASTTKVYTSLLIGRAIKLGYLTMEDLHKPIVHFLSDLDRSKLPAGIEKITLHHTLSMQSGLQIPSEEQDALQEKPALIKGQKYAEAFFTLSKPVSIETQHYNYQGTDPDLTMMVLEAVVPGSAMQFIRKELLAKLDITNFDWGTRPNGLPHAGASISITSRDMIKLALLVANGGAWNGEQLISKSYLGLATTKIAAPHDPEFDYSNFRYGYFFWGTSFTVNGKNYDAKFGWGGGNQYTMAIDSLDLAIAITARIRDDEHTFKFIEKQILPAFIQQ